MSAELRSTLGTQFENLRLALDAANKAGITTMRGALSRAAVAQLTLASTLCAEVIALRAELDALKARRDGE